MVDCLHESAPQTNTFRVQTASAVGVTRSINKMRVSQRLFDLQQISKSQIQIAQVTDPLEAYPEFRGLLISDYKEALAKTYSNETVQNLKREAVSQVNFADCTVVKSKLKSPYITS